MDKREENRKIAWMSNCARAKAARHGRLGINDAEDIAQNVMIYLLRNKFLGAREWMDSEGRQKQGF